MIRKTYVKDLREEIGVLIYPVPRWVPAVVRTPAGKVETGKLCFTSSQ